jgi:hypothetical protein
MEIFRFFTMCTKKLTADLKLMLVIFENLSKTNFKLIIISITSNFLLVVFIFNYPNHLSLARKNVGITTQLTESLTKS